MALWSVRVVLAGKGLSLYDIMVGRDDGCIERDNTSWLSRKNATSICMAI